MKRNKIYTAHANAITYASRIHGAELKNNPTLTVAVNAAKKSGMPKTNIDSAILRGQGKSSSGAALESTTIEAVLPPVALIIDVETDRKAHDLQELRAIVKDGGGREGQTSFMFERRGRSVFRGRDGLRSDEILDVALENGACDVFDEAEGRVVVETEVQHLKALEAAIQELGLPLESSNTIRVPLDDTIVDELEEELNAKYDALMQALNNYPTVQAVYSNVRNDITLPTEDQSKLEASAG